MLNNGEISFRPMELADIPDVMLIERSSFPTPWSEEVFRSDLTQNDSSQYVVGELNGRIVAYGGIWLLDEVGHITTIAVSTDLRRRGFGETTLEVRRTNEEAIRMYEKHGFKHVGVRKNYYKEINEDALVMWTGEPPYEG